MSPYKSFLTEEITKKATFMRKKYNSHMKRLFKLIILFLIIFAIGVVVAIDSIHDTFEKDNVETVNAPPKIIQKALQVF